MTNMYVYENSEVRYTFNIKQEVYIYLLVLLLCKLCLYACRAKSSYCIHAYYVTVKSIDY